MLSNKSILVLLDVRGTVGDIDTYIAETEEFLNELKNLRTTKESTRIKTLFDGMISPLPGPLKPRFPHSQITVDEILPEEQKEDPKTL